MSNTDSFVDEVTEEVRRDRLYALLRRYGWIAVLAVIALVAGAAYVEWRDARARSAAELLGDSLSAALEGDSAAERAEALAGVDGGAPVSGLLLAAARLDAGDSAGARTALEAVVADEAIAPIYRDLAQFKAALLPDTEPAARIAALDALAVPGAPLRLLATEQRALLHLEGGETEAGLADLRAINDDAEAGQALRERVTSLMVALGEDLSVQEEGATAAPAAEATETDR